ncbi:MAG TPA: hypothetical protein VGM88_11640 [Kofleriaceae bacterium]|jgi:hypothetical protein
MSKANSQSSAAAQSDDVVPSGASNVAVPGRVSAAAVKAEAVKDDPRAFLGMACDDDNRARLHLDASECVFTAQQRRDLDDSRVNEWNKVADRFNSALEEVALEELREALGDAESSQWIADLVLSVLTDGISTALEEGLKLLRSKAASTAVEHLAHGAAAVAADAEGPVTAREKLVEIIGKASDASVMAPVSKSLESGKKAVAAQIAPAGSSDADAQDFLSNLREHSSEVLGELATPSATLSDFAIVAQLKAANSPSMKEGAFVKSIGTSLRQWMNGHLGRIGVDHKDLHLTADHVRTDPDGVDTTRKVVRVEYDGEPRYAVYKSESFTRAKEKVGDESGTIESIVPQTLETAAVAQHVSRWGAQPTLYRGFVGFISEPKGEDPKAKAKAEPQ